MDKIRQALNVKNFSVRQINTMLANCVDNPQLISETLIVFIAARNHAIDNGRLILAGELTAAINSLRKKI
jgi:hypothetical protein